MNVEQRKEYAEYLKSAAKEFIDGIGIESERGQQIIKLIYGFTRSGFLESKADRGSATGMTNNFTRTAL
jgi:hypothetical protein